MPTSPRLPIKLHERLGDDAMTELLTLFGDLGADTRAELQAFREETRAQFADVRGDIAALKDEMADLKTKLNTKIAGVQSELIKWTFLFWLGTIGIVVLLLRLPA